MPNSENRQDTVVGRSSLLWMNESHRLFKNGNHLLIELINYFGFSFFFSFCHIYSKFKIQACFSPGWNVVKPNIFSLNIFYLANDPNIFF